MPRYRELAENLAIDGISDLLNHKGCGIRTMWIAFFMICITVCTQQLYMVINGFITEKHWRSNTEIIQQPGGLEFPPLTVCNINRINRTKAENDFNITNEMLNDIFINGNMNKSLQWSTMEHLDAFYAALFVGMIPTTQVLQTLADDYSSYLLKEVLQKLNMNTETLLYELGHSCDESALYCGWKQQPFSCCEKSKQEMSAYGKCFLITPDAIMGEVKQTSQGSMDSLRIILDTKTELYLGRVYNNPMDEGFVIFPNYNPFVEFSNPIAVAPGFHTFVEMRLKKETTTFTDWQIFQPNCRQENISDFLKLPYSFDLCSFECLLKSTLTVCNCAMIGFTKELRRPECSPQTWSNCVVIPIHESKSRISEVFKNCTDSCEPACERKYIETSITMARFPSRRQIGWVQKYMNLNKSEDYVANNFVAIDLYFKSLSYEQIEWVQATTMDQLLSNIGGQVGLWMGASVVTVYQLIMLFCCGCCGNKKAEVEPEKPNRPSNAYAKSYPYTKPYTNAYATPYTKPYTNTELRTVIYS